MMKNKKKMLPVIEICYWLCIALLVLFWFVCVLYVFSWSDIKMLFKSLKCFTIIQAKICFNESKGRSRSSSFPWEINDIVASKIHHPSISRNPISNDMKMSMCACICDAKCIKYWLHVYAVDAFKVIHGYTSKSKLVYFRSI